MKQQVWLDPNHALMETAHKTFNRQVTAICHGQVISPTQYSHCVRAFNETVNPVGETVAPGYLQRFDLDGFNRAPNCVLDAVARLLVDRGGILYEFKHRDTRRGKTVIHGYVLTADSRGDYKLLGQWVVGRNKSANILAECIPFITK